MTSGMISLSSKDQPCWRTSVSPQQQRPSAVARSLSAQLGAAPGEERQAILSFLDSVSEKHHQAPLLQSGVMEISNRTETQPPNLTLWHFCVLHVAGREPTFQPLMQFTRCGACHAHMATNAPAA
jgi:hypothetical protein